MAPTFDAAVERWLTETNPSLGPAMRRVAQIVLSVDPAMTAYVKYGTVTFGDAADMAGFVQAKGKRVSLMFNRGAKIPGRFPHLEGDGPSARFMRFADLAEVEKRAKELAAVTRAWCDRQAAE